MHLAASNLIPRQAEPGAGTVEGLRNKAMLVIHKAYGFRTAKKYIHNLFHCVADLPL